MYRSKLIDLIRCLDKAELDQLDRFMHSPFFFKTSLSTPVLQMFAQIKSIYPDFESESLAKEKMYELVFPNETWDSNKLAQIMTQLTRVVQSFIHATYQQEVFNAIGPELSLLTFYAQNNRKVLLERQVQKMKTQQTRKKEKGEEYFWTNYLMSRKVTVHAVLYNSRKSDLNLPHSIEQLDKVYLVLLLEYACVLLGQQKLAPLGTQNSLQSLEAMLPLLEQGWCRDEPTIDLLYQAFCFMRFKPSMEAYQQLKQKYYQHQESLSVNHQELIHSIMRNFCLQMINKEVEDYPEELFELYQDGLKTGVLLHEGNILSASMQSMVTLGIKLEAYDWVEQFLQEYRSKITGTDSPEEVYSFNYACLLFAKGEFESALNCLVYNFADIYLRLAARRMEVQIYYELKSELLESKIQAFKIFVYRISKSKLTDVHRTGYNNFIDILKQINHPSTQFNKKRIENLVTKLNDKKTVSEKKWLLQKLAEL